MQNQVGKKMDRQMEAGDTAYSSMVQPNTRMRMTDLRGPFGGPSI